MFSILNRTPLFKTQPLRHPHRTDDACIVSGGYFFLSVTLHRLRGFIFSFCHIASFQGFIFSFCRIASDQDSVFLFPALHHFNISGDDPMGRLYIFFLINLHINDELDYPILIFAVQTMPASSQSSVFIFSCIASSHGIFLFLCTESSQDSIFSSRASHSS